jgi:chemotaxis protein MotB
MPKRKTTSEEPNTSGWMTTFTNLMILLLAFFIVLVNMGSPDPKKKQAAMGSLFGSFGIKPGGQTVIGSLDGEDITVGEKPILRSDSDYSMLQNVVLANGLGSDVMIRAEAEKIVISLENKLLFDKKSSNISEKSLKFLAELSDALKDSTGFIELKGYTDHTETMFETSSIRGRYE